MSNPTGPDEGRTERMPDVTDPATEIIGSADEVTEAVARSEERRFTAPSGFDESTQKIDTPPDPETEVFAPPAEGDTVAAEIPKGAAPQVIPPRDESDQAPQPAARRSWGWVVAVVLVIAALVAIAVLGTVLLTRKSSAAASQEDAVRETIQNFDSAIQRGDLATLRSITCGTTSDNYVKYDQKAWDETHARVAAAKQYPVVASIDQVIVHGDHAEANVTSFMAFAPQTRSSRSFDLQFRDNQWKICQAPTG
ncbi:DUF4878 domain-containing protein [Mycolicibacterium conceptionense]|uniref:Rv0361 family membrane protein n=1 Tax=Mycolicibacterium conceptionense TaxID=451644 RepID=UPI0007ED027E|nr:DUF4878 domain-containing protein [Mycolicibacterium conceptionense]OBJ96891.1 DUF4878 domain-containing protein [Mycolicibacterium conceptionense]OMB80060.1 DUF4878 domain-containing protein [Mycolicibacterium conceptionense]OMB82579.1 DUF4878 domain-containing protein [Mycolicibacterium conceptionense]